MRLTKQQIKTIRDIVADALATGADNGLHSVTVFQRDLVTRHFIGRSAWFEKYAEAMEYVDMIHGKYTALGRWHGAFIDGELRVRNRELEEAIA